eukprot:TRINITY_DN5425_c0_g1_i1.p1 TRINITY_DN5425_c0_g1~~TRINITY_DN5425_c0_g1_i1.p1  ORF type:complete len:260 (-),score=74.59 TRINITY_DN5425_c0_g1_i1:539-1318(-)
MEHTKKQVAAAAPAPAASISAISTVEGAEQLPRVQLNLALQKNLAGFWQRHGIDFALFWLMMSEVDRSGFVKAVVPDIKEAPGHEPSDLLLPELNMGLLQAHMGKGLVAVMQTRASMDPGVDAADLELCRKLDVQNQMPIFSGAEVAGGEGDAFRGDLAFVLDDQRIVVCNKDKSEEDKAESERLIATGKVTDANQFITKNVRRTVLLQFCCGIADKYLNDKDPGADTRVEAVERVVSNLQLQSCRLPMAQNTSENTEQ